MNTPLWLRKIFCFDCYWYEGQAGCRRHNPPTSRKSTEILPGVDKPSFVLAGLIASYILAHPDKYKTRTVAKKERPGYSRHCYIQEWSDNKMSVSSEESYDVQFGNCNYTEVTVKIRGKKCDFSRKEEALIITALAKTKKLLADMEEEEEEAQRQQLACDHIELFAVTPETTEGEA